MLKGFIFVFLCFYIANAKSANSREYKIMLQSSKFTTDHLKDAQRFWFEFSNFLKLLNFKTSGIPTIKKHREVKYYDTNDCKIRKSGFILRERFLEDTSNKEINLKARHVDRFITGNMNFFKGGERDEKFEEDIKPPFVSAYSYSATELSIMNITSLLELTSLFDNIDQYNLPMRDRLHLVGDVYSRVYSEMFIDLTPKFKARADLTMWYHPESKKFLLAELSVKCRKMKDNFDFEAATKAFSLYQTMIQKFDWNDSNSPFKSEWIYKTSSLCK
jgi:hypothetical protein